MMGGSPQPGARAADSQSNRLWRFDSLLWPAVALAALWAVATTTGPFSDIAVNDLFVYRQYEDFLDSGKLPYLDFGFEYPPLAAVPLWLAGIPGGGESGFEVCFAILMAGCAIAGQQLAARVIEGRDGLLVAWLLALQPVVIGASLRTHFDPLPVAILLGALVAFTRDRPTTAFALLGVGTMTKLFPALLVPLAAVWLIAAGRRHEAVRGVLVFAIVTMAFTLPFAGQGYVDQFEFHLERPVQIESTPASVLFALGGSDVTGTNLRPDRFKSNGLDGGAADVVQSLFAILLAGCLAFVCALAARDRSLRHLGLCCFAALLAFVALGKVLSPQFVIWLAPFAALAWAWRARVPAALCVLAIVLTHVEFPSRYFDLIRENESVIWLVGIRNALLLAALAMLLRDLSRAHVSKGQSTAGRSAIRRRFSTADRQSSERVLTDRID